MLNENFIKQFKGKRALSLIKQNALDKVNKLETIPFEINDEKIQKVIEASDFEHIREKLGLSLSLLGKGSLVVLPYRNSYIIEFLEVTSYSKIGSHLISLCGTSGMSITIDGASLPVYTEIALDGGTPKLRRYYIFKEERVEYGEEYIYEMNDIPAQLFLNNHEKESDVEYHNVVPALVRLDEHDKLLMAELNRTRTTPVFNEAFTDMDPASETEKIDSGEKPYRKEDSFNNKYGQGFEMIPATLGTSILQQQIIFLEDDIKAKLGIARDTVNSGSNQHNLEIVMSNQYGTETLLKQQKIREKNWNIFFDKLASLLKAAKPNIKLKLSLIEDSKLQLLEATILEAQIKAKNISSQGNSDKGTPPKKQEEDKESE